MATALDLLMSEKEDVNLHSEESDICTIDVKTRVIFVPSTIVVGGVQSDKNAERIKFSCPKIVGDNLDLSKFSVRINFENVSSVDFNVSIKDQYICNDVAVDGENVTFSWLIGRNAARYMGTVRFIVCAVKTDSDSNISVEWNTAISEVPVLEGIEIDQPQIGQEEKDVINQLLELTKNTSAEAVQNVNSAKEQAIKDIQSVSQPDTTLTIEGGLAEAKATGEAIGSLKEDIDKKANEESVRNLYGLLNHYVSTNLFDKDNYLKSSAIRTDNGQIVSASDGREVTNKLYCNGGDTIYFSTKKNRVNPIVMGNICAYDKYDKFLGYVSNASEYTVPSNTYYALANTKEYTSNIFVSADGNSYFVAEVGKRANEYVPYYNYYIEKSFEELKKEIKQNEKTFITLLGVKYWNNVNSDGAFVPIKFIPDNVYVLGNSITAGFYSDNDNANGLMHGMASSTKDTDYVALVTQYLKTLNPDVKVTRRYAYSGWYLEETICNQHGGSIKASFGDMVKPYLPDKLDLAIIWLGDNVNDEVGQSRYKNCMEELIKCFKTERPECRVLCCGLWYNATNLYANLQAACKNAGAEIVDMRPYHTDENTIQYGDVVTDGSGNQITISSSTDAKSHPNDKGMRAFADEIIKVLSLN